jgi:alkanesulfonate monooxygenase SsuD/methylene tetrahydromethanopterin reductase-like flavin-dependent oxidoreductase (luciferase family)
MNFGLLFPFRNAPRWHRPFPQYYAEQLAQVRLAEQLGYDMVWLSEHHFSEDGYSPSLLPIAASIATMTTRIRIGTNLIILPLHNALRMAALILASDAGIRSRSSRATVYRAMNADHV